MVFDGVHYGDPFDAPAIASHPHAPLASDTIVAALVAGYFAGRRNAVRVVEQAYPRLERDASDGLGGRWITGLSHQDITSGYAWVDGTFTHAVAVAVAECIVTMDVVLHTRIAATDGLGGTKTGTDFALDVAANARVEGDIITGSLHPNDGVFEDGGGGVFLQTAELELSGLTLSDRLYLAMQSYAGSVLVPGFYRPRYAAIYLEARG